MKAKIVVTKDILTDRENGSEYVKLRILKATKEEREQIGKAFFLDEVLNIKIKGGENPSEGAVDALLLEVKSTSEGLVEYTFQGREFPPGLNGSAIRYKVIVMAEE